MATKQITRNIALTPHFDRFVAVKVESGRYQSASEVVREGLRLLEQHDEQRKQSLSHLDHDIRISRLTNGRKESLAGPSEFSANRKKGKPLGRAPTLKR